MRGNVFDAPGETPRATTKGASTDDRLNFIEKALIEHQSQDIRHDGGIGFTEYVYNTSSYIESINRYTDKTKSVLISTANYEYDTLNRVIKETYSVYDKGGKLIEYSTMASYSGAYLISEECLITFKRLK